MNWFLCDNGLRHERVNVIIGDTLNDTQCFWFYILKEQWFTFMHYFLYMITQSVTHYTTDPNNLIGFLFTANQWH